MFNLSRTLGTLALALAGLGLQAEDFRSLMTVTKTTWPEKSHIGVVCDYRTSKDQVMELAQAAGPSALITVVDVHTSDQVALGTQLIANRKAEFMVLLPDDRLVRDGSFDATLAIHRLALHGIPSVGTSAKALDQGAVFSMGDGTAHNILVTNKLIGTVGVILPDKATFRKKASLRPAEPQTDGMARIAVVSAK